MTRAICAALLLVAVTGVGARVEGAPMAAHGGPVKGVAVAADGRHALTAGFDYSLILWDLDAREVVARLHGHEAAVNAVLFLPDAKSAVSASDDGTVGLWDLDDAVLERRLEGHEAKVVALALSPDGEAVASAGWDRTVRVWDLADGGRPLVLEAPANLDGVAFSRDGKEVLAGDAEGRLHRWRLTTGSRTRTIQAHDFAITGLDVSTAGDVGATASVDETVQVIDLGSGDIAATLYGHEGPVLAVALSPDGELVASGGIDGTVRVWRRGDGDRLRVFERHQGPVWSVAFSVDGTALLSGGADGLVITYDLDQSGPEREEVATKTPSSVVATGFADDGSRGAKLFRTCAACHTLTPDGGNRAGPTLHGLFGRKAGEQPGYPYSEALEEADLVWTEETVSRLFEVGPEVLVPGSKMPLQRMPDPGDRAALIAWLRRVSGPAPTGDTEETRR